jgi:hypothetical protein
VQRTAKSKALPVSTEPVAGQQSVVEMHRNVVFVFVIKSMPPGTR